MLVDVTPLYLSHKVNVVVAVPSRLYSPSLELKVTELCIDDVLVALVVLLSIMIICVAIVWL